MARSHAASGYRIVSPRRGSQLPATAAI
jgi:hypothetical protein